MSDANDPTTRLPQGGAAGPADRTEVIPGRGAPRTPEAVERTQVLPGANRQPMVYTEDYRASDDAYGTEPAAGDPGGPVGDGALRDGEEEGRTWPTLTLVLVSIAALLVGAVMTLLLLPEEDPQVALDDAAAAQVLTDQTARITELETTVAERDARVAELEAQVAAAQAQQEGDQAAADQAATDRQAALDAREQALNEREATVASREDDVAQREQTVAEREAAADAGTAGGDEAADGGSGGFDLPEVSIPADLPQIDEDAARGVLERFVDRIQSFFG